MTTDRDELAQQLFLSRNGGGSWMSEFEDTFDFAAAQNEADFVLASGWLSGVKREAKSEAKAREERRYRDAVRNWKAIAAESINPERIRAASRLLADSGDITPQGVRVLEQICDDTETRST